MFEKKTDLKYFEALIHARTYAVPCLFKLSKRRLVKRMYLLKLHITTTRGFMLQVDHCFFGHKELRTHTDRGLKRI